MQRDRDTAIEIWDTRASGSAFTADESIARLNHDAWESGNSTV